MKRTSRILLTAALVLLVLVSAGVFVSRSDRFSNRLGERVAEGGDQPIDFASVADFDWDRVYFFPPYPSQSNIEKTLGFQWPGLGGSKIESSDGVTLIVFVKGNRVVHAFDHPRNQGDFTSVQRPEGFTKREAQFVVLRDGHEHWPVIQLARGKTVEATKTAASGPSTPASRP
jgi:hypothetical protein